MSPEHAGDLAARTVRAQRFELVDDQGNIRAVLEASAHGPVLTLFDAAGKRRAGKRRAVSDVAGKHTWKYIREKVGDFTCVCGGKGKHQVIIANEAGEELAVGKTCLRLFNVEMPKVAKPAGRV